MYEPVTAESALNTCCGDLLTTIGLSALYSEYAIQVHAMPPAGTLGASGSRHGQSARSARPGEEMPRA